MFRNYLHMILTSGTSVGENRNSCILVLSKFLLVERWSILALVKPDLAITRRTMTNDERTYNGKTYARTLKVILRGSMNVDQERFRQT